ncbi:MAG TPA: argininosuccinate lyase [Oscillospiraceae bacterium]|nr:argininosuccinate lyase [Oscillospiraceae bacterium]HPF56881.1 argininosuccinate lyase [Clostridiales bacterium]HPK35905.1 argininosuccinate lyase [Oscillospiraceae bacterium]HPR76460.1 argininosuccinate lyase [Oscillospiraceae bacterium]
MKLWGARFERDEDGIADDFNSSIRFDQRLWKADIEGSIAHARMLSARGIIPSEIGEKIVAELYEIKNGLECGTLSIDPKAEDIHMFVEQVLTERIGDAGKYLHTARSRNDQVALDLRLWQRDSIDKITGLLKTLVSVIADKAEENINTVMPGYTHLQPAQPVTFAHHILTYAQAFLRDIDRLSDCRKRTCVSPIGSCALAGTTYSTDRFYEAELLELPAVCENSMDGVSDRDFALEFCFCLSAVMTHLSRFCEEIILWSGVAYGFLTLDDAWCTGSSIMPQKKNPDIAELCRGKSGRVFGDLTALLTVMKGLPMAYNKDMQEDKEAIFDATDTVCACLTAFTPMFSTAKVNADKMRAAAADGFINATDCADYLVGKGLPFRDAYHVTGELVKHCVKTGKRLEDLSLKEYQTFSPKFEKDVFEAIKLDTCVSKRKSYGGPAPEAVAVQLKNLRDKLNGYSDSSC